MDFFYWYIAVSIFIIGMVIGSFMNCVIWRSYCGESAARGRSYCPKCRHKLCWLDLVPVASFLMLGGKCRYCGKPISGQYPAVELAVGLIFWATAAVFTPQIFLGQFSLLLLTKLLAYWVLFSSLAVIFVADLRWYFIPDGALLSGILGAAAYNFINAGGGYPWRFFDAGMVWESFLSAVFAALIFLAIYLLSRGKWIGFGDVKFAFLMGLAAGFPGILVGMFFANFFGAILGLALVARGKKKMSSQVPFGPFLVAGTVIAVFFSDEIFNWYLSITF
jgi:leader peptidase (prepilin peptidase) / N-methyltransferase